MKWRGSLRFLVVGNGPCKHTFEDPLTTRPSNCTKWDVYLIGWGKLVRLGRVRRAKAEIVVWIEWGIVVRTT